MLSDIVIKSNMFECAYVIGRVIDKFAVPGRVVGWDGISVYAETGFYMG